MTLNGEHATATSPPLGARIPYGTGVYNEVMDFLIEEARLLDGDLLEEWQNGLAEDIAYTMPVRQTVLRSEGPGFDPHMGHFDDDLASIGLRVQRLVHTHSAYAEDPPSRVRRFVTNVRVHETATDGEYAAASYLLLMRNRGRASTYDFISAVRHDLLRRQPTGFKLARREVLVDLATLGTPNLAIFL